MPSNAFPFPAEPGCACMPHQWHAPATAVAVGVLRDVVHTPQELKKPFDPLVLGREMTQSPKTDRPFVSQSQSQSLSARQPSTRHPPPRFLSTTRIYIVVAIVAASPFHPHLPDSYRQLGD